MQFFVDVKISKTLRNYLIKNSRTDIPLAKADLEIKK